MALMAKPFRVLGACATNTRADVQQPEGGVRSESCVKIELIPGPNVLEFVGHSSRETACNVHKSPNPCHMGEIGPNKILRTF